MTNDESLNQEQDKQEDAERIRCWICPAKYFDAELEYQNHTQELHGGFRYRCDECEEDVLFRDIAEARDHVNEKHDINVQPCEHCDQQFNEFNMMQHLREVHQQAARLKCELCDGEVEFADRASYENHVHDAHQGHRVKCKICHRMLKTKLSTHMEYIHSEGKARCNICNKDYSNKYKLMRHMKCHTDPKDPGTAVRCERCNETFENVAKLNYHKAKHQTKVFQCDKCSKMFYRNGALVQHQKTHETSKFQCEICYESFNSALILRKHSEIHQVQSGLLQQGSFKCYRCGNEYPTDAQLQQHMESHANDPKFVCKTCNEGFETRKALTKHMRTKGVHDHLKETNTN